MQQPHTNRDFYAAVVGTATARNVTTNIATSELKDLGMFQQQLLVLYLDIFMHQRGLNSTRMEQVLVGFNGKNCNFRCSCWVGEQECFYRNASC
jgi:hypothetical protein